MENEQEPGPRLLSVHDLQEAARTLEQIRRLDDDALALIDSAKATNRIGKLGEEVRRLLGNGHTTSIGSDVLGELVFGAVLAHMAGARAVLAGRVVDLVVVPSRIWDPDIRKVLGGRADG